MTIQSVFSLLSLLPGGAGDAMKGVNDKIQGLQNKFNDITQLSLEDFTSVPDSYKEARAKELARQEAAKVTAELDDESKGLLEGIYKNTGDISANTAAKTQGKAGQLTYAQMGVSDIWDTVRAGAY
jgi:hypothetical protein